MQPIANPHLLFDGAGEEGVGREGGSGERAGVSNNGGEGEGKVKGKRMTGERSRMKEERV
jgi:hypothetical protein